MKRMLMMGALVAATATSLHADGKGHMRAGSWHTSVTMNDPRRGPMKVLQHIQSNRTGDCTP